MERRIWKAFGVGDGLGTMEMREKDSLIRRYGEAGASCVVLQDMLLAASAR